MKTVRVLIIAVIAVAINVSCSGQAGKEGKTSTAAGKATVEVYYFHFNHRCATCNAVENVSSEAVARLYGGKVKFASYNLDEKAGEEKGKELGVSVQTLLIVSADTMINITNEGFMNARTNPGKLEEIIKEKIDPLL